MSNKVNSITEQGVIVFSAVLNKFKTKDFILLNFEELNSLLFNKDFRKQIEENGTFFDYIKDNYKYSISKLKEKNPKNFEKNFNDLKLVPHIIREPKIEELIKELKSSCDK